MDNGTISATTDAFGHEPGVALPRTAAAAGASAAAPAAASSTLRFRTAARSPPIRMPMARAASLRSTAFNSTFDQTARWHDFDWRCDCRDSQRDGLAIRRSMPPNSASCRCATGSILTANGAGTNAHAGNAVAGTANLNLNGATINAGLMSVSAVADGGEADDPGTVNGGNATGGTARLFARGAPARSRPTNSKWTRRRPVARSSAVPAMAAARLPAGHFCKPITAAV